MSFLTSLGRTSPSKTTNRSVVVIVGIGTVGFVEGTDGETEEEEGKVLGDRIGLEEVLLDGVRVIAGEDEEEKDEEDDDEEEGDTEVVLTGDGN